jgi:hypothetical protein
VSDTVQINRLSEEPAASEKKIETQSVRLLQTPNNNDTTPKQPKKDSTDK